MKETLRAPASIWAALVSLTWLSILLVGRGWLGVYSSVAIIVIAALKARVVILHYMDATHAPARWRFLYELWNFVAATVFVLGYFIGLNGADR
jgi:hypothetical protein